MRATSCWLAGLLHQLLGAAALELVARPGLSLTPVRDALQMDPHSLGDLDGSKAADACATLSSHMPATEEGYNIEDGMNFKKAMRIEGGIDGVIALLRKHGRMNHGVATRCLDALHNALFYVEENQHYGGSLGAQEVLIDVLRANMEDKAYITARIGEMGGLMDFCNECGDLAQKHGSDELMMDVMRKYFDDKYTVQNCLNGLTGNVYHSDASRSNLHKLGLIKLGLDIMEKYPYGPPQWLQIRQEVIAVMSGLAQDGADAKQVRQAVIDAGYFAQVLKLMREQPTDVPSQGKSCEFIRNFAGWDVSYARKLVEMGAIEQIVESMSKYKTPSGNIAGKFWNVDQSGSDALRAMVLGVPESADRMVKAGAVQQLVKAAKSPEGGYQTKERAALDPACEALQRLSGDSEEARKAVTATCSSVLPKQL